MDKKKPTTARTRSTTTRTTATKKAATPRPAAPRKTAAKPATKAATPTSAPAPAQGFHPSHEQIAAFAYSLFEQSGHQHGRALEHWLAAEAKLQQGLKL